MILRLLKRYPAVHLWLAFSLMVYSVATIAVADAVKHFEIVTFTKSELFDADITLFIVLPTIVFLLTTYLYFELMAWTYKVHQFVSILGLTFFFLSSLGALIGLIQFKLLNLYFLISAHIYIRFQEIIPESARLQLFTEIIVNVIFMTLFLIGMILMRYFFTWHHEVLQRWHKHNVNLA